MTVFVYVNTSKQVDDAEHIKVFATTEAAVKWLRRTIRRRRLRIQGDGPVSKMAPARNPAPRPSKYPIQRCQTE